EGIEVVAGVRGEREVDAAPARGGAFDLGRRRLFERRREPGGGELASAERPQGARVLVDAHEGVPRLRLRPIDEEDLRRRREEKSESEAPSPRRPEARPGDEDRKGQEGEEWR